MNRIKRLLAFTLALALLLPLAPEARAEGMAPAWVAEERYLTFPNDPVYEEERWVRVLEERQAAEQGALLPYEGRDWAQGSVGECYETALIRRRCAENYTDEGEAKAAFLAAGRAFGAAESGLYDQNRGRDETYYRLSVEKYRAFLIYHVGYVGDWGRSLVPALDALDMTLEDFLTPPIWTGWIRPTGPSWRRRWKNIRAAMTGRKPGSLSVWTGRPFPWIPLPRWWGSG